MTVYLYYANPTTGLHLPFNYITLSTVTAGSLSGVNYTFTTNDYNTSYYFAVVRCPSPLSCFPPLTSSVMSMHLAV